MKTTSWSRVAYGTLLALAAPVVAGAILRRRRRWDLRGRRVLITGGSRGLGFATARLFLREGAEVAICARDPGELERARAELRTIAHEVALERGEEAPRVVAFRADVTDQAAVDWMVAEVRSVLGGLDILVNCAVEIAIGPLEAMTAKDYEQAFRGIFLAMYYPTMAVVPQFRAQHAGRIVNVTSIAGKLPIPHNATYVVGKYATTGFSAVCNAELRKYGIRVSTVMPPPLRNGAWMNAGYKGQADEELAWFVRALSSPFLSIDPERAARAIVEAARHGDVETMVAPSSWLQSRAFALFPELTSTLLAVMDRYGMPATPLGARAAPAASGAEILATTDNPRVHLVARDAKAAAENYLQPLAANLDDDGKWIN
jgi:NAD(P)-dependent dehydrogenase (short-subunit alcohol dehydrogenase family)